MATDHLNQFLVRDEETGEESIFVEEGAFKGWVPKAVYSKTLVHLRLPFLRLLSFPCGGGTSLGSLASSLVVFDAPGNYLSQLPLAFAECRRLKRLDLSFNHFSQIPAVVFKLARLEELNFAHNYLQYVDRCVALLKNLKALNLAGNMLTEIPEELGKCRGLKRLNISGKFYAETENHLKSFPECVCDLPDLISLDLCWQKVNKVPSCIGRLKRLETLNLKRNQLVDVSKDLKKCTRLRSIDLSGALRMRSAIPEALLSLEDVQDLNLSDNFFTEFPSEVCGLVKITSLVAQRNSLLFLSVDMYKLRYLETLELNQNYLRALPEGIRLLKRLRYLSLDNNELTSLPDELCEVESLCHLTVDHNEISELPENISMLTNLDYLNVANNRLTEIPLLMDRLTKLADNNSFHLANNQLRSPFREMCEQRTCALFDFLKGIRVKEARHRWKMILIGAAHAGKTSLRRALMLGHSHLTAEDERTWVMERHLWEPESRLRVQVLDFGGHHIYQAAHHMFLSSDAYHVLVFDLSKYTTQRYHEVIGHWLDAILDRASGATVVIAATHCDLCSAQDVEERTEDVLRLMRRNEERRLNQINKEIRKVKDQLTNPQGHQGTSGGSRIPDFNEGRLQDQLNTLHKMKSTRSKLPDRIHVVSCAGDLTGMSEFQSSLVADLKAGQATEMPGEWFRFLERLQENDRDNIVPFSDAVDIFSEITRDSPLSVGMCGSKEKDLEVVLRYLHSAGELVWYKDDENLRHTVFHRPDRLIQMLRAVFRHDFDAVVTFCSKTADMTAVQEKSTFDLMKNSFLRKGLMSREFMIYVLARLKLSEENEESFVDLILSLMIKFNLCFEVVNPNTKALNGSEYLVQFPWFFPVNPPKSLKSKWEPQLPPRMFELGLELKFSGQCPPNFFEKLSVKMHTFLSESDRDNWKDGVLAQVNSSALLVQRLTRDQDTVISATARGSGQSLLELWNLIRAVRNSARSLAPEWPMLKIDTFLVCSHCVLKGHDEPYRYPGHVMDTVVPPSVYHRKCCDKSPEDNVPACLVFPLDEFVGSNDHAQHLKAANDFMDALTQGEDTVDGRGVLPDRILSMVANQLGAEWKFAMLGLGVDNARIEQALLECKNEPMKNMLLSLLMGWRHSHRDTEPASLLEDLIAVLNSEEVGRTDLADSLRDFLTGR